MSALVHAGSWPAFATPAPDQPLLDNCLECLVQLKQLEFNVYSISKSFPSLCSYQHLESKRLHHCHSVKKVSFREFLVDDFIKYMTAKFPTIPSL
jgi:hypothetical protein